jgi:deazaflavin-dependent oxidoreductase (nitroreductase family)
MPLPRSLARFNRRFTNRILSAIPARLSPFVFVEHVGRRTGTRYRTPVAAFGHPAGWVIALTYGSGADWVGNVQAADGAVLYRRGVAEVVSRPMVVGRPEAFPHLPVLIRLFLRLLGATEFLVLHDRDT